MNKYTIYLHSVQPTWTDSKEGPKMVLKAQYAYAPSDSKEYVLATEYYKIGEFDGNHVERVMETLKQGYLTENVFLGLCPHPIVRRETKTPLADE